MRGLLRELGQQLPAPALLILALTIGAIAGQFCSPWARADGQAYEALLPPRPFEWKLTEDGTVRAVCDGPHRVYIAQGRYISGSTAVALAVVPGGCEMRPLPVIINGRQRPTCTNKVGATIPCPEAPAP